MLLGSDKHHTDRAAYLERKVMADPAVIAECEADPEFKQHIESLSKSGSDLYARYVRRPRVDLPDLAMNSHILNTLYPPSACYHEVVTSPCLARS